MSIFNALTQYRDIPDIPIVEVLRGTTHDGPGMRATVFVKGCPLACRWCQNPEAISLEPEIWTEARNCIACGECVNTCTHGAPGFENGGIQIRRDICKSCGGCVEACPAQAITFTGACRTEDDLFREVLKDRHYYANSGGGVTVSGGEPLLYADFLTGFFMRLRKEGVHTALDTCGHGPAISLLRLLNHSDMLLYDIKLIDSEAHRQFTGVGNEIILGNLQAAADFIRQARDNKNREIQLWVRTPLIPNATADPENIGRIAWFIAKNVPDVLGRWELCAFNPACHSKYARLGQPWAYEGQPLLKKSFVNALRDVAVRGGVPEGLLAVTGIMEQDVM